MQSRKFVMFVFRPETSKRALVTQMLSGMLPAAAYQRPTHSSPSLLKSLVSSYFLHSLVTHYGLNPTSFEWLRPRLYLAIVTIDVDTRTTFCVF